MGLGMFNALLTLLEQFILPVYYTENSTQPDSNQAQNDSGIFGGIAIAGGVVGALIMGVLLDATHKFGLLLKIGTRSREAVCFLLSTTCMHTSASTSWSPT